MSVKFKKYLLVFFMTLPSIGFTSPYSFVTTINEYNGDVFIDYTSLQKNKNIIKVWMYIDIPIEQSFQKEKYLSIRQFVEIYCDDRKLKVLETTYFEKNHLQGRIIFSSSSPTELMNIPPNSLSSVLRSSTCFLKK